MAGDCISDACKEAVAMAMNQGCDVEFDFNGIKLVATPWSSPCALEKTYHDDSERRSREYRASPEYKAQKAKSEQKEIERKTKAEAILKDAPASMTLRDAEGWKKARDANKDPYGNAVMTYAERWARMMEAHISKGVKLATIADKCSRLADEEGITGFMHGCAVNVLSAVWIHGEELRNWSKK